MAKKDKQVEEEVVEEVVEEPSAPEPHQLDLRDHLNVPMEDEDGNKFVWTMKSGATEPTKKMIQ
jgi:hypothetical protein|tara:strand:+ start:156 stop:347 length:192 start_codon:yes stop_codon:yes gene_type:complete